MGSIPCAPRLYLFFSARFGLSGFGRAVLKEIRVAGASDTEKTPANRKASGETDLFSLKTTLMKPNQNLLIAQVVKFLNSNGCCAWRQENNGRIDQKELVEKLVKLVKALKMVNYTDDKIAELIKSIVSKCYKAVPSSRKGVSDVIGFHLETGYWISVEVKVGNDVMRPDQTEFATIVRRSGGAEYWLCREIESFKAGWLKKRQSQKQAA